MSHELVPISPEVLALLKGAFGKDGVPMPFVKEIFLMSCHVAGTSYRENIEEASKDLKVGDLLVFRREADNPHDELAILILNEKGQKLGYVPREKNEVLARLMDAGKLIFGKVEGKEWIEGWLKLDVRTYMRDV
jgi:hypothetical protein